MPASLNFGDEGMREAFHDTGCIVVRGMFEADEMAQLMERMRSGFNAARDGEGEIAPGKRAQVLRRVEEGSLPRFLRMFYESTFNPVFMRLIELRNHLAGLPPSWAAYAPDGGWWTAARFNQYPRGGGFMAEHADSSYVGAEPPGGFVQPILYLTERGKDYQKGGAYMCDGAAVVDMEPYCKAGDVLVYDGRMRHGVAPVDPEAADESGQFGGRVVAAVTTLRVLS